MDPTSIAPSQGAGVRWAARCGREKQARTYGNESSINIPSGSPLTEDCDWDPRGNISERAPGIKEVGGTHLHDDWS